MVLGQGLVRDAGTRSGADSTGSQGVISASASGCGWAVVTRMACVVTVGQIGAVGVGAAEVGGQGGGGGGRGILHSFLRYALQSIGRGVSSTAPQTRCISTCSVHSYSSSVFLGDAKRLAEE
jgi:hypothetical protein